MNQEAEKPRVLCIGAGPAGLTAAYRLSAAGACVTVLERNPTLVGGISRTETYKGYRFDVGGHRFFSRSKEIEALWEEILGDQLLTRQRKSRILFNGRLFDYPLRPINALSGLGIFESVRCLISYFRAKLFKTHNPKTFEDWVTNQFGHRLYSIFFKSYTEKVWGMKCKEISADWAAQRIKGLSLGTAMLQALVPKWLMKGGSTPKSLIETFRYPRLGPGQMWEVAAEKVSEAGGEVFMGLNVDGLCRDAESGVWTVSATDPKGKQHEFEVDHVISSTPIADLVEYIEPSPPEAVMTAARMLRYRDFVTVALIIKDVDLFDDNWIYVHDPNVKVGRIQNFKSWSPHLVPDPDQNCLGLEYFCFKGDGIWDAKDEDLLRLADEELIQMGLVTAGHVIDGTVIRQSKAYPVYDENYEERIALFRIWLESNMQGLHLVGRNGMHKYNNQDHAMMTALLTAENILAGEQLWDIWRVNEDADYHEVGEDRLLAFSERAIPRSTTHRPDP
jgi:protoporphyrinogen oxidase